MVEMNCPSCGQQLKIDDEYQGKAGRCNACGATIHVPMGVSLVDEIAPPLTSRAPILRDEAGSPEKPNIFGKTWGGCLGRAALVLVVLHILNLLGFLGEGQPETSRPEPKSVSESRVAQRPAQQQQTRDLSDVEENIRREIRNEAEPSGPFELFGREVPASEGLEYRLHDLKFEGDILVLTLDLQFRPVSKAFLAKDAKEWADMVLYSKVDGEYVADQGIDVRVSLWTVFAPDEVIDWGAYRHFGGRGAWSEGRAVELLN